MTPILPRESLRYEQGQFAVRSKHGHAPSLSFEHALNEPQRGVEQQTVRAL